MTAIIHAVQSRRRRPRACRPRAESLEARLVLATIEVTNTLDAGAGSLRQAILTANATPALDTVVFAIPADDPGHVYYRNDGVAGSVNLDNVAATTAANVGDIADIDPDWPHSWYRVRPLSALSIGAPLVLDGTTQPGTVVNSNPAGQGLNTVLRIEIDGSNAGELPSGLLHVQVAAAGSTLRGLAINRAQGPKVYFDGGENHLVEGSFIGPDISGSRAFPAPNPGPNATDFDGLLFVGSVNNAIGGTTPAARNLLSANNRAGAGGARFDQNSPGNTLRGNLIGTDRSGTAALGNGVGLVLGTRNTAGGAAIGAENVISGNLDAGVLVRQGENWIERNTINDNAGAGVLVQSFGTRIIANTITRNASGVTIASASRADGNVLSRNAIFANSGLGINLVGGDTGPGGVTPNDVPAPPALPDQDTGPNGLQNFPTLESVIASASELRISGSLRSTPNTTFTLEFFANAERDAASGGLVAEGQTYLGQAFVFTNAEGLGTFVATLPPGPAGQPVFTATAGTNNVGTSEFSEAIEATAALSTLVTSTADSGPGSLRAAIANANSAPGRQTITFAIPVNDPGHVYYRNDGAAGRVTPGNITRTTATDDTQIGDIDPDWPSSWWTIRPATPLPEIVETITIDGYSQPGSRRNTLPALEALNTVLKVELDGSAAGAPDGRGDGLVFGKLIGSAGIVKAKDSRVEGLTINRWQGDGIELASLDGGNVVAGNFMGTDVSGLIGLGNQGWGLRILDERFTMIGGTTPADRNLISGNRVGGVSMLGTSSNLLEGNNFGADRRFEFALAGQPVAIRWADVETVASPATGRLAQAEQATPPNRVVNSRFAQIVKNTEEADSLIDIVYKKVFDRDIDVSKRVLLLYSLIRLYRPIRAQSAATSPPFLGIDLGNDGVTSNDGDNPATSAIDPDSDRGPNGYQNAPVLVSAVTDNATTVKGRLVSTPRTRFRIEVYASSYDTRLFRAGERSLGTIDATTDANGQATFTFRSPTVVPAGWFVTALATAFDDSGPAGGTSEFSNGLPVVSAPSIIDARLTTSPRGVTAIVLEASGPLNASNVSNVGSYVVVTAGLDGRFGTRDDAIVPLRSATFNATTGLITLTPRSAIPNNTLFQLTARSSRLTGPKGARLDGNGDGRSGDDYRQVLGHGSRFNYTERDGDRVSLNLKGGGTLLLSLSSSGDATSLKLNGTGTGSTLSGSVTRGRSGNGRATLGRLSVQVGRRFQSRLSASAFRVSAMPKDEVDYLLAMSGGTLRGVLS